MYQNLSTKFEKQRVKICQTCVFFASTRDLEFHAQSLAAFNNKVTMALDGSMYLKIINIHNISEYYLVYIYEY